MDLSYNWLTELLPGLPKDPKVVEDKLTAIGLELEETKTFAPGLDTVVIAQVKEIAAHPKREKLNLVTVTTGPAASQTIVCGANNVPPPGGLVVLAPLGTTLPAIGMTLEPKELGGIISEGMLCSEVELGLGLDAAGILVFEAGRFSPGTPLYSAFPTAYDTIFTIGVTPNRPDALGHVGVARDLAAVFQLPFTAPAAPAPARPAKETIASAISITNRAPDQCPRYGAMALRGARIAPSPEWLRWRLTSLGLRAVSNIVDITNLMLLEYGNPMHAFDLEKLGGQQISIRQAAKAEPLCTLDGEDRSLTAEDLVICDQSAPVALAGIMGGAHSEIGDDTTDIVLECAYFAPTGIRRSARRLGMGSDSSFRFERGVNWSALEAVLNRASNLIVELAGATALDGQLFADGNVPSLPLICLRSARLDALLGYHVDFTSALEILTRLGFEVVEKSDAQAKVRGAAWRPDVSIEADLIEEVVRIRGLDEVPAELPAVKPQTPSTANLLWRRARLTAASLGLSEAVTYSFVSRDDLKKVKAPEPVVTLQNPMSVERDVMCTSLLPGLIESVRRAQNRGEHQIRLFTVAARFLAPADAPRSQAANLARPATEEDAAKLPQERLSLAAVLVGNRTSYLQKAEALDVFDAKGIAVELVERLTHRPVRVEPMADNTSGLAHLHPRGAARVLIGDTVVGQFGPLHPDVVDTMDLMGAPLAIEIDLVALEACGEKIPQFRPIPRLPAITRDIAVETRKNVPASDLESAISDAAGELCESVNLFDVFTTPDSGDLRSMAFRVVYRDPKATTDPDNAKTLTDKRVDKEHAKVVKALAKLGATQRT